MQAQVRHVGILGAEMLSPAVAMKSLKLLFHQLSVYFALSIWTAGLLCGFGATTITVLSIPRFWALVSLSVLVSVVCGR